MENNFQYTKRSTDNHRMLKGRGFIKKDSAIFNQNDPIRLFVINEGANTYWTVDQEGFNDANRLVKHITGKEIQHLSA